MPAQSCPASHLFSSRMSIETQIAVARQGGTVFRARRAERPALHCIKSRSSCTPAYPGAADGPFIGPPLPRRGKGSADAQTRGQAQRRTKNRLQILGQPSRPAPWDGQKQDMANHHAMRRRYPRDISSCFPSTPCLAPSPFPFPVPIPFTLAFPFPLPPPLLLAASPRPCVPLASSRRLCGSPRRPAAVPRRCPAARRPPRAAARQSCCTR